MPLRPGKLEANFLARLLGSLPPAPEIVLGPGIGHDTTVLNVGADDLLVAKADPITFATSEIGYYAVAVNANDIATSGGLPKWFLATILLPEQAAEEVLVTAIFDQLKTACAEVGAVLVGGHTEITCGLSRPIVAGQMLGQVPRDRLVRPDRLTPGDLILLTKGVAVEGVSIIARERRDDLLDRGHKPAFAARCAAFLHHPGLMVLPEARAICRVTLPHALHDPTEGGLATGLWEMAQAGGVGLRIDYDRIPIFPEAETLGAEYGLDPLGLIASGALLAAVAPEDAAMAIAACTEAGIACCEIGCAVPAEGGVVLVRGGTPGPMPRYDQDEITRLFER